MELKNEDGYRLWLRYDRIADETKLNGYRAAIRQAAVIGESPACEIIRYELGMALPGLLGTDVQFSKSIPEQDALVVGTLFDLEKNGIAIAQVDRQMMGDDGYLIRRLDLGACSLLLVAGGSPAATVHGMFAFLRLLQTGESLVRLNSISKPRIKNRILAHWDNLEGDIERGYALLSLWRWNELPGTIDPRYRDYARACASVGLNGVIINNPNSRPEFLDRNNLRKMAALADVFRPYGLRIYLSPEYNSPMGLGGLKTGDPRDPAVAGWWKEKVDEIYELIPDFGGFQVKANSEGQPGPWDYGADHRHGANVLANALHPHGGICLWRAFVYDVSVDADRAKCAYKEFTPLDGEFAPGTFIQVKNGPVDFQPREPFHPLFGAMPKTPLAMEFQIAQEYLGHSTHLVFLAPMWKEVLDSDTCADGNDSLVAYVVDGSLEKHDTSAIVAVANSGSDRNWCGHHFAQANWYAYGRLAWDHELTADDICEEWIRMTWSNVPEIIEPVKKMMMGSWEACVDYMTPLGLHHIMQEGHHYGPNPAYKDAPRVDWSNVYYHRADKYGLGFDRSSTGSNAVGEYHSPLREQLDDITRCPEKYLLWFHHVPWSHVCASGRILIEELQAHYDRGFVFADWMLATWEKLSGSIDTERYEHVLNKLYEQLENAWVWRETCMEYFRGFAEEADR